MPGGDGGVALTPQTPLSRPFSANFSLFSPDGWVEGREKRAGVMRGYPSTSSRISSSRASASSSPSSISLCR